MVSTDPVLDPAPQRRQDEPPAPPPEPQPQGDGHREHE